MDDDVTDLRKQLGLALKHQREAKNLSQSKLAELANISTHHLADIEGGKKNFTMKVLDQLATALDWDPLVELTADGPPLTGARAREVVERLRALRADGEATLERLNELHADYLAGRVTVH
jgi:transcriptional regulator with XRE-family HTH domain